MFRFRATTRLGFAFDFAFGFGRTITSMCSWGIGTTKLVELEREATPSRATAGSIATVGTEREAMTRNTSGCARRDRRVCIFWNGLGERAVVREPRKDPNTFRPSVAPT